jgi:amino acid adenylation domain-containing protein
MTTGSSAISITLSESERHRLVTALNDTDMAYAPAACISESFEAQAARTPDAVAVIFEDDQLTYRELNQRGNQLARYLRRLGVGPDAVVGLFAERSLDLVVAIVGIMKAGAAYLPMDTSYPEERVAFMLDDTGAPAVLTQRNLRAKLPRREGRAIVCLDSEQDRFQEESAQNFQSGATPDNSVYAMYTSGSTGVPKGVLVSHRALHNRLSWMRETLRFTHEDRVLHKTALVFDGSVLELLLPLITGARLVVARPDGHTDGAYLVELVARHGITYLDFAPALLQLFLDEPTVERCNRSVRFVLCGGEALPLDLHDRFFERLGATLYNDYGPTETCVAVTIMPSRGQKVGWDDSRTVPIGRPIANTQVYLLDRHMNLVPFGEAGELYVGGVQLARGYLNRPGLTAERFLPDPFGTRPGGRLYRTGDLARYLPDGNLEFIGRADQQVKLRGFRIELGEIEAALAAHHAVREAVVVLQPAPADANGSRRDRLVGYVSRRPEQVVTSSELQRFLRAKLPDYMVPGVFVALDAMPLTTIGKVDRRALPIPDHSDSDPGDTYVAPRSWIEETLAGIWASVLGVDRVGIHNNFFELGGDSVLAIRMVARSAASGVTITPRQMFEYQTIAQLAEVATDCEPRGEAQHEATEVAAQRREAWAGYTPSDFPLVRLDQRQVDRLVGSRQDIEDVYPLSPMQEGMLFHSLFAQQSGMYVGYASFVVEGRLDLEAFTQAWQHVLDRHAILRTRFAWEGLPTPLQVVFEHVAVPIEHLDWRALPPEDQHERRTKLIQSDLQRGYDLRTAPLLRLYTLRLANEHFQVIWSMHHAIMDGWSMPLVFDDLWHAYDAIQHTREPGLPASRPYRDYIAWLQAQDPAPSEKFWRDHLRGFTTPGRLGVDRAPTELAQVEQYAQQQLRLPEATRQSAESFARQHQVTLHTLVQGAWALLLSQYGASRDVVFGTVVSGRPPTLADVESIVGLFINTLPARVSITPSTNLCEWLQGIQRQQIEMRDYGYAALTQIQQWSEVSLGQPLFESILVFENYATTQAAYRPSQGIVVRDAGGDDQTNYPLTVVVTPGSDLNIVMSYRTDRFADSAVEGMLNHLRLLIERMIVAPDQPLGNYACIADADRTRILQEWNNTRFDVDVTLGIPERIAAWAERAPDAVAVAAGSSLLTFGDLNRRAEHLAARLRGLGVGEDTRVGICVERSIDMVIGLLAILKAGGAYVPMDPTHPRGRLIYMLDDAGTSILLTQRHLQHLVPERPTTILIDEEGEVEGLLAANAIGRAPSPLSLAYVIYTSGSTGEPKGVEVSRAALINRVAWYAAAYEITPEDRTSQFYSVAFDVCGWEIWPHLAAGASVHIIDDAIRTSPHELQRWLLEQRITFCDVPTSVVEAMLDLDWPSDTALRCLQTGGQKLRRRSASGLPFRFVNNYGPTENTVTSTCYPVLPSDETDEPIAIGTPIGNTEAYVLDAQGQLAPVGVPGELVLAGESLARGYLNRPGMTAERFIPNPLRASHPGARLYRTGDLARYLPSGNLEFLGRLDTQVKIRGFRVELGEIEAALATYPALHGAAVMVRDADADAQRLVAYVVPRNGTTPDDKKLGTFLKDQLPSYMVPDTFVVLDSLPLNRSGKVDYARLPAPAPLVRSDSFVTPRTAVEEVIAAAWSTTLGVPRVGVEDNFFDLGGHSLLATRLMSQIHDVFHVDLPMRVLFEAPTVAGMAHALVRQEPRPGHVDAIARRLDTGDDSTSEDGHSILHQRGARLIPPRPPADRAPLSFAQQRLWFLDQLEPGASTYVTADVFRLRGQLDTALFERSLQALVDRHESLRTTFAVQDGKPLQVVAPTLRLLVPKLDLRELPGQEREARLVALAGEEAEQPFDLAKGPLIRVTLVQLAEYEHALLLTMHHIVTDGWSMGIFIRELTTLYTAFARGAETTPLAPLTVQYADFATWQQGLLQSAVLEDQMGYWKRQLTGAPYVLDLPTDHTRPPTQTYRAGNVTLALTTKVVAGLKVFGQKEGATLFMTLLSAFAVVLSRYTRQQDMLIATTIANRNHTELEDIIGFFVNTLVLRTDVSGNPTFRELVQRVRELCLDAYAHQDVPFDRLVEELQPERDMSRMPLVQVMFTVQNAPRDGWDLAGVRVEPVDMGVGSTPFDLAVELWDGGERVECSLVYNRDVFEHDTIARMAGHFESLLVNLVGSFDQRVGQLELLTAPELDRLAAWNDTAALYPADRCVHHLIEEQAARAPDSIAVADGNQQLTYHQFNAQADQLAAYLRGHGVGPDVVVGLCMPRCVEAIVAMLGILKAGGAYLPLDPTYPDDRLAYMVHDAGASIIVTQHDLRPRLLATAASILCVDTDWPRIAQHMPLAERVHTSPDALAYVIYTSGSTGQPKGVMVQHGSLTSYTRAIEQRWNLRTGDRALQFASISFDASVHQIIGSLTLGATLILRTEDMIDSAARFLRACDELALTVVDVPTAYWHELTHALAHDGLTLPPSVRLVWTGGDKPLSEQLRTWRAHVSPSVGLVNAYGPTEATIAAAMHDLLEPAADAPVRSEVPIGRALHNVQLYVVDPYGQRTPMGVPGELLIGGVQVARGYMNRPVLTAERFIPDSFGLVPGGRLYRTGDLVRFLADGNLEYLGRIDNQVKIRGFRIETGEVEAAIAMYPSVRDVTVVARDHTPGDRRLVAYVLADPEAVSASDVRLFLKDRLPAHMIPSVFVVQPSLPLTASGKLDRRRLPAPDTAFDAHQLTVTAPQTPTERALADIWTGVLGVRTIGTQDSFFDLGGHSLLATRVVSRVRETFQVDFPLRRIFETPTLSNLAAAIDNQRTSTRTQPSLTRRSREAYRLTATHST